MAKGRPKTAVDTKVTKLIKDIDYILDQVNKNVGIQLEKSEKAALLLTNAKTVSQELLTYLAADTVSA